MVSVFFRGRGGEENSQLRGSWPSHSSPLVLGHGCRIQLRPEMSGAASGARLFVCRVIHGQGRDMVSWTKRGNGCKVDVKDELQFD